MSPAANQANATSSMGARCAPGKIIGILTKTLDLAVQLQMLDAAATAIDLIEAKVLSPRGEQAELFLPEPQTGFTNGLPIDEQKKNP